MAADFLKIHRGSIFFEDIEKVYEFDKILVFTIETKGESTESTRILQNLAVLSLKALGCTLLQETLLKYINN